MSGSIKVCVVQAAPVWLNKQATIEKACGLIAQAGALGAKVIAFPESFIPAFPYGVWHHGLHRNNHFFKQLYEQAVELPHRPVASSAPSTVEGALDASPLNASQGGQAASALSDGDSVFALGGVAGVWPKAEPEAPITEASVGELAPLCAAARAAGAVVVMGITERAGGSLYNTQVFIGADGALLGSRRKLKPTSAERLVWGEGDGSGLRVFDTPFGKVGGLMCGEHNFALARYTLQSLGEQIHVASYPDPLCEGRPFADRLEAATRHYAAEGQCFVLNATGFISEEIRAAVFDTAESAAELDTFDAYNGASSIIAPDGSTLAGPLSGEEGILVAEINLANIAYAKYWFDAPGHSSRHDIFRLQVDFSAREPVSAMQAPERKMTEVTPEVTPAERPAVERSVVEWQVIEARARETQGD